MGNAKLAKSPSLHVPHAGPWYHKPSTNQIAISRLMPHLNYANFIPRGQIWMSIAALLQNNEIDHRHDMTAIPSFYPSVLRLPHDAAIQRRLIISVWQFLHIIIVMRWSANQWLWILVGLLTAIDLFGVTPREWLQKDLHDLDSGCTYMHLAFGHLISRAQGKKGSF